MRPTRGVALAALVLLAVAAPVGAFALADDTGAPHSPHAGPPAGDDGAGSDVTASPGDDSDSSAVKGAGPGAGPAHAAAMKAWAHCVAQAASGPKTGPRTGPPKLACGTKPVGPGRAAHGSAVDRPHGKSGAHRH